MNRPYTIVVMYQQCTDDTYAYFAFHPEIEGCHSQGDTVEEAIENLADACTSGQPNDDSP